MPVARLLALALAVVAGFGPGAVALAHGHAHEHLAEAHEHRADHHRPVITDEADRAVAHAEQGGDDHAHPRLDASAITARGDFRLDLGVALPVPPVVAFVLPPAQSVAARVLTAAPPRAGPAAAPPPPSRAPPLG